MSFSKFTHSNYVLISYLRMTKRDVAQYLEKIYNVPVVDVRVKMVYHDLEPVDIPAVKTAEKAYDSTSFPPKPERYEKVAYVHLAPGEVFVFPDLFKDKRPSSALDMIAGGDLAANQQQEEQVVPTDSKKLDNKKFQPLKGVSKWFSS
ncbi:unnamed protein product [Schistosoma turkestanicum]|nr:unnamed protein product [Schistosoma turkestanicum]